MESEGLRQAAILKAEGEKQARVLEADGRKEASFRDAEARERLAEAEAKQRKLVSDAIANGNVQAINYFVANNYVKALEALASAPNSKIIMMPLEASSIIGSLGGLAQIAAETFGGAGSSGAPKPMPPRTPIRPGSVPQNVHKDVRTTTGNARCRCISMLSASSAVVVVRAAVALLVLETIVPGVHFLWFGVGGRMPVRNCARRADGVAVAAGHVFVAVDGHRVSGAPVWQRRPTPNPMSRSSTCAARNTSAAS